VWKPVTGRCAYNRDAQECFSPVIVTAAPILVAQEIFFVQHLNTNLSKVNFQESVSVMPVTSGEKNIATCCIHLKFKDPNTEYVVLYRLT
jgi:hypothetical protein